LYKKATIYFSIIFLLAIIPQLSISAQVDEFKMANKFYQSKDYDSAIRLYKSILKQGRESAALYYNLGNAYFKKGDIGYAVLYYMKAKRLDPSDDDIRQNLKFAKQFSKIQMEGVTLNPINSFFVNIVDPYRLSTLAWISSIFFILFFVFLIIRYGMGMNTIFIKIGIIILLVLLVISSSLTTFKYHNEYIIHRAVVVSENSPVYTGPSDHSDIEFEGAPGLVVEILGESSDYFHVLFENKRQGWIKKEYLAKI